MNNMFLKAICPVIASLLCICASAQSPQTIKGTVTDKAGEPLPGVAVYVDGTTNGTSTDIDGKFSLTVNDGDLLLVSMIGYATREIHVDSSTALVQSIVLEDDAQMLEEAVTIGYGTVKKKDLTGSIQSINGDDIVKSMHVDPAEALNGRVSGVLVTKSSNRPGTDMSIQIRGANSFNYSNAPLVVIDGVPSQTGLRHLNPEDIQSMDILKDASSCAIYGSRGANGVIIITTKGGGERRFLYRI